RHGLEHAAEARERRAWHIPERGEDRVLGERAGLTGIRDRSIGGGHGAECSRGRTPGTSRGASGGGLFLAVSGEQSEEVDRLAVPRPGRTDAHTTAHPSAAQRA